MTVIRKQDSTAVGGAVTNAAGMFGVNAPPSGSYFLRLSAIGYVQSQSPDFDVSGEAFDKDFGVLVMKPDITRLNEITLESMRPTITQEADKMVVRVEGTAMAAGNTAFAVLSRMPGV
ncbi:MAG: TonB-dependent receptor, partial [Sphingobacteriales bacterium]